MIKRTNKDAEGAWVYGSSIVQPHCGCLVKSVCVNRKPPPIYNQYLVREGLQTGEYQRNHAHCLSSH